MFHPAIAHPICHLDQQERLRAARAETLSRSVRGARRTIMDRLLHRPSRPRAAADHAAARLGPDVWAALRL